MLNKLRIFKQFIATLVTIMLCSCATTEKLAEGISVKNISGNGTFAKNSIGLNPETKIPEISSTFVSGDYSSAKSGTNSILYRSESTGSIWNAKVLTKKQFVSITLVDTGDVGDVIRAVSEVLKAAGESDNGENDLPAQSDGAGENP